MRRPVGDVSLIVGKPRLRLGLFVLGAFEVDMDSIAGLQPLEAINVVQMTIERIDHLLAATLKSIYLFAGGR